MHVTLKGEAQTWTVDFKAGRAVALWSERPERRLRWTAAGPEPRPALARILERARHKAGVPVRGMRTVRLEARDGQPRAWEVDFLEGTAAEIRRDGVEVWQAGQTIPAQVQRVIMDARAVMAGKPRPAPAHRAARALDAGRVQVRRPGTALEYVVTFGVDGWPAALEGATNSTGGRWTAEMLEEHGREPDAGFAVVFLKAAVRLARGYGVDGPLRGFAGIAEGRGARPWADGTAPREFAWVTLADRRSLWGPDGFECLQVPCEGSPGWRQSWGRMRSGEPVPGIAAAIAAHGRALEAGAEGVERFGYDLN